MTERDLLDALHARYGRQRNGMSLRYALAEHVSTNGNTFWGSDGATRICDFLAQDTYAECLTRDGRRSQIDWRYGASTAGAERRILLHGHEVKVSRSDWLRELADPAKSEAWLRYCDRWWLVAPKEVVRGDLPERWGHLAPTADGSLRVVKQAPLLDPEPMPPLTRAQIMRAVQATAGRRVLA